MRIEWIGEEVSVYAFGEWYAAGEWEGVILLLYDINDTRYSSVASRWALFSMGGFPVRWFLFNDVYKFLPIMR